MTIRIQPNGDDRYVAVTHEAWASAWRLQFPEAIYAAEGAVLTWPNCNVDWEALENGWGYTWRTTEEYVAAVRAMDLRDSEGKPQHTHFFVGLALRAEVRACDGGLQLSLTLTNESSQTAHNVWCEGGCWQAKSDAFIGAEEVARSYVMVGQEMVSMASLPRSVDVRCRYRCDPSSGDTRGEWFWGRSAAAIDHPAIVGAVSADGGRAVVLGYASAGFALQNADGHHCLHSGPHFGDIAPGRSVGRTGYVLFGDDIQRLGRQLRTEL